MSERGLTVLAYWSVRVSDAIFSSLLCSSFLRTLWRSNKYPLRALYGPQTTRLLKLSWHTAMHTVLITALRPMTYHCTHVPYCGPRKSFNIQLCGEGWRNSKEFRFNQVSHSFTSQKGKLTGTVPIQFGSISDMRSK